MVFGVELLRRTRGIRIQKLASRGNGGALVESDYRVFFTRVILVFDGSPAVFIVGGSHDMEISKCHGVVDRG